MLEPPPYAAQGVVDVLLMAISPRRGLAPASAADVEETPYSTAPTEADWERRDAASADIDESSNREDVRQALGP